MSKGKRGSVVIWDVDDVLNELMREWFDEWWLPRHPECAHRYGDIAANPPHTVLGIPETTYLSSLDAFREARFAKLPPRPEVLEWFSEHGHRAQHVALSAPPESFAHLSAAWVIKHFGQWIRTFAFVPARRGRSEVAEARIAKGDYLEWLGHGDVFLDDREANVEGARALGMKGIVVPQPWNTSSHGSLQAALQDLTALI
jgi:FMN phosphatase YigB (HAD superfamily)